MSYLNQTQDTRSRLAAIAGVTAIHAAIGIGLVVGLSFTGLIAEEDEWDPFTITPDPLPKPPPPEPTAPKAAPPSVVVIPPTPLPPLRPPENTATQNPALTDETALAVVQKPIVGPTPEPLRSTLFTPRKARPSNDPQRWISTDDYPARALRAEAEGVASYRLIVGTSGRVSACEVTRSTGNGLLDDATCDFITRRARFEPATDDTGAKVVGAFTGSVKWEIPE
jgi:periplasmic protein TonB